MKRFITVFFSLYCLCASAAEYGVCDYSPEVVRPLSELKYKPLDHRTYWARFRHADEMLVTGFAI